MSDHHVLHAPPPSLLYDHQVFASRRAPDPKQPLAPSAMCQSCYCTMRCHATYEFEHGGNGGPSCGCGAHNSTLTRTAANGMVRPCSSPTRKPSWRGAAKTKEHAMSEKLNSEIAVIG